MKNRQDIQVLRGIAVLMVVLFHARIEPLRAGYLGVDVFFVISGFLITAMVIGQIQGGTFSFCEFYFRRAKRLLPAAYTTFLITTLASMWLLTSHEFIQFTQQLWAAVTFTSNIVLLRQGSYFGGEADLKPLLHTWSLAIEEQYYLLLPVGLYFLPARHWFKTVLLVLFTSAVLCAAVMIWRPDVAFYLLPTRAWELAIGSLGVFLLRHPKSETWARRLFWPALLIVLLLPVAPLSNKHPGLDAWLICWATLVLLLARHHFLNDGRVMAALSRVGDWSYSLYLIHWPIFALASNVWMGNLPIWVKYGGIALSLLLAYLQYTFVEDPLRHSQMTFSASRMAAVASASGALIAIPYLYLYNSTTLQEFAQIRRGNTGLSPACAFNDRFRPSADCVTGSTPKILVWGDSYAMHLMPGIMSEFGSEGVVQATKYVCGPLVDVAPVAMYVGATQNRRWAEGCLEFNDSVLSYLRETPSIRTVVLSSVFKQYVTAENFGSLLRTASGLQEQDGSSEIALHGLAKTIEAVRSLGKNVVVVGPPPAMDWDAGRCAERLMTGMVTLGADADCATKDAEYKQKRSSVLSFLKRLPEQLGVEVIMFDDILREGSGFMAIAQGKVLFITNGHLSYEGSEYLANKLQLRHAILKAAK